MGNVIQSSQSLLANFDREAQDEAAAFLKRVEERALYWEQEYANRVYGDISPEARNVIELIDKAFEGVTCYRELRVLLGGEAEDEYMSPQAQALLVPLEERQDWRDIPEHLLLACQSSLSYVGPHAYRFLLPAFICAELRGAEFNTFFPGQEAGSPFWDLLRGKCVEMNEAQQASLSAYMNYMAIVGNDGYRERFWPWELDDYAACYADSLSMREYGHLLVQQGSVFSGL